MYGPLKAAVIMYTVLVEAVLAKASDKGGVA